MLMGLCKRKNTPVCQQSSYVTFAQGASSSNIFTWNIQTYVSCIVNDIAGDDFNGK